MKMTKILCLGASLLTMALIPLSAASSFKNGDLVKSLELFANDDPTQNIQVGDPGEVQEVDIDGTIIKVLFKSTKGRTDGLPVREVEVTIDVEADKIEYRPVQQKMRMDGRPGALKEAPIALVSFDKMDTRIAWLGPNKEGDKVTALVGVKAVTVTYKGERNDGLFEVEYNGMTLGVKNYAMKFSWKMLNVSRNYEVISYTVVKSKVRIPKLRTIYKLGRRFLKGIGMPFLPKPKHEEIWLKVKDAKHDRHYVVRMFWAQKDRLEISIARNANEHSCCKYVVIQDMAGGYVSTDKPEAPTESSSWTQVSGKKDIATLIELFKNWRYGYVKTFWHGNCQTAVRAMQKYLGKPAQPDASLTADAIASGVLGPVASPLLRGLVWSIKKAELKRKTDTSHRAPILSPDADTEEPTDTEVIEPSVTHGPGGECYVEMGEDTDLYRRINAMEGPDEESKTAWSYASADAGANARGDSIRTID